MNHQSPQVEEAWILGTGTAALASAFFLIKYASIRPSKVHLLDSHPSLEQAIHFAGNAATGYDQFAGCLPVPIGAPLRELLSSIPSSRGPEKSLFEEINNQLKTRYQERHGHKTSFAVRRNGRLERIATDHLNLGASLRIKLMRFMLKNEDVLGRSQIRDHFSKNFFRSDFWVIWSAQFCFQPWHSAIEFRRSIRQYLREFSGLDVLDCLDITGYYQHEQIFFPIFSYLRNLGVDYQFDTRVKEIFLATDGKTQRPKRLDFTCGKHVVSRNLGPHDILIATLGSTVSGSQTGSNDHPPHWNSMWLTEFLDENWSIWLELGNKDECFGDPYNFCARQTESMLESFTITTEHLKLFKDFQTISQGISASDNDVPPSQGGAYIVLQESSWKLVLCVPQQPVFTNQPENVRVLWGFASSPYRHGNYIPKPMVHCSGVEIMTELCRHLGLVFEPARNCTITIPRVMPRMSALSLARRPGDRPCARPIFTSNIGLVGQFVEIPLYTSVDSSYGIRTAEVVVSQLTGFSVRKAGPDLSTFSLIRRVLLCK